MTKDERRQKIQRVKDEINPCKSRLLDVVRRLEEVSPRKAEQLQRLVSRIEDFQNKL